MVRCRNVASPQQRTNRHQPQIRQTTQELRLRQGVSRLHHLLPRFSPFAFHRLGSRVTFEHSLQKAVHMW